MSLSNAQLCGETCYCLKTAAGGECKIIDTSKVGYLPYAVNKSVIYEGTTDEGSVNSNKHCPRYIRLYGIKRIE